MNVSNKEHKKKQTYLEITVKNIMQCWASADGQEWKLLRNRCECTTTPRGTRQGLNCSLWMSKEEIKENNGNYLIFKAHS